MDSRKESEGSVGTMKISQMAMRRVIALRIYAGPEERILSTTSSVCVWQPPITLPSLCQIATEKPALGPIT
jgi:hypothetical protein